MRLPRFLTGFAVFAALLAGCTQTIHPPRSPAEPTRVYVADYGLHSSIFLPQFGAGGEVCEDGPYVEYAFGDWPFMALGRQGLGDALSAVWFSPRSALGRRVARIEDGWFSPGTRSVPERLTGFYAARADVQRFEEGLDERHRSQLHTGIINPEDDTVFVQDPEHYWLGHNCNHVTLRWLKKLGCDVRGLLPLSHFRLGTVRE